MPVGRMKARRPLRVFLSEAVRATRVFGVCFEAGEGAEGEDEVRHAGEVLWGDGLASESDVEGGDHAPGDGLAVEELLVVRWRLRWRGRWCGRS